MVIPTHRALGSTTQGQLGQREQRTLKFPNVNVVHWGESYWGKRWIERESLVSRPGAERYDEEAQICETHS